MKIKNKIFVAVLSLFVGEQIYGAQMNPEDNRNLTLFYAVRSGDQQQAQVALDAGADANWQVTQDAIDRSAGRLTWRDLGDSSLYLAVNNNNLDMVRLLLERLADVNAANRDGQTSLFVAVRNYNLEMVQLLLDRDADVNFADRNGWTSLLVAVGQNNLEMAQFLLERGADINFVNNQNGWTPLLVAVRYNNLRMALFLLDHHADPNTIYNGRTLLGEAIDRDNVAMVQALMNSGRLDQDTVNDEKLTLEEEQNIAFQAGQDWPEIKHQILNTLSPGNYI